MTDRDARDELRRTDALFAALSHASRRHVLHTLHLQGGRMTAGQIAERFSCSWPTTSRHLAVLRRAGLVRVEKHGRERVYVLERAALQDRVHSWLSWFDAS